MSAPRAAAQLCRLPVSLGDSFRPLLRGRGRRVAPSLPSRQTHTNGGEGRGCTAIELSKLRQDRSADFSPLPSVLAGPERGGLKSALLIQWQWGRGVAPSPQSAPFLRGGERKRRILRSEESSRPVAIGTDA